MKRAVLAATASLFLGAPAMAQVVVYGGADLNYDMQLDKAAGDNTLSFQPYVEAELSGFYAGLWLSVGNDTAAQEVDVYLGYRIETATGMNFDAVYTRYYYPNAGGDCCGDITLSVSAPAGEKVKLNIEGTIEPDAGTAGIKLGGDYAISDRLGVAANIGVTGVGSETEWDLGGSYSINDQASLGLTYYDGTTYSGYVELNLSFDTTLFGG